MLPRLILIFLFSTSSLPQISSQDVNKITKCSQVPQGLCGMNSKCFDDADDPKVQEYDGPYCKCDADTYGKPPNCKSYCVSECKATEYCDAAEKVCKTGCKDNDSCMDDEYCQMNTHQCWKGCRSDENCKDDEYCSDGNEETAKQCVKGCRSNERCPAGQFCDHWSEECKLGCYSDAGCKDDEFCNLISNQCETGCRSHDDCAVDEYCCEYADDCDHSRGCRKGCRSDYICNDDEYCDGESKECRKGCRTDGCNAEEICDLESRKCKLGCLKDSQCKANEFCSQSEFKCIDACVELPCGTDSFCTSIDHKPYCSCKDGYFPEKGVGCKLGSYVPIENFVTLDCENFCGENASCDLHGTSFYCFCPQDFDSNPFLKCRTQLVDAEKSTNEVPITVASVATLSVG